MLTAKATRSPSRKTGCTTKMSGMCMPPSKGSLRMKTSPGSMSSPKRAKRVSMAYGTAPRCRGIVTPWAIISPSASHREVE